MTIPASGHRGTVCPARGSRASTCRWCDRPSLRSWDPPPGERTHVATGEPGALWHCREQPPSAIYGVAFAMEGFSQAQGDRRSAASYNGPGKRFFEGIVEETIGDFGYVLGGAAGDECDRFD